MDGGPIRLWDAAAAKPLSKERKRQVGIRGRLVQAQSIEESNRLLEMIPRRFKPRVFATFAQQPNPSR